MKHVIHISRKTMIDLARDEEIPESHAIISISDTNYELAEIKTYIEDKNVAFFQFQDVDDPHESGCISLDQAKKIVAFIEKNKDKDYIIVHCFIGVSRSGAVAKWINEEYGLDLAALEHYKAYNRKVYDTLDAAIGKSMAAHYAALEEEEKRRMG
jgi:predicted protein tyrosine phosphatase